MRLKTLLILLISPLSLTLARTDEFGSVEDETDYREGRILWPYPLIKNETERGKDSNVLKAIEDLLKGDDVERQRRYLTSPPFRSKSVVADTIMNIMSNYKPTNAKDPLDFLRDPYPLPQGNTCFPSSPIIVFYLSFVPTIRTAKMVENVEILNIGFFLSYHPLIK